MKRFKHHECLKLPSLSAVLLIGLLYLADSVLQEQNMCHQNKRYCACKCNCVITISYKNIYSKMADSPTSHFLKEKKKNGIDTVFFVVRMQNKNTTNLPQSQALILMLLDSFTKWIMHMYLSIIIISIFLQLD